jgi:hypothetical protein
VWEWDSMKKAGVTLVESYFPIDLVKVPWFHFHSPRLGYCMID